MVLHGIFVFARTFAFKGDSMDVSSSYRCFLGKSPYAAADDAQNLAAFLQTASIHLARTGPVSSEESSGLALCFDLLRDKLDFLPKTAPLGKTPCGY